MKKSSLPRILFAAAAALSLTSAARADVNECPPTITSCGCLVDKPGVYKVGLNLDASQGLNENGSCIGITSSFVAIDFAKATVTGSGANPPTGTGVFINKGVHTLLLEGRGAVISGWDVGILLQGNHSTIDNFTTSSNGTAGIELSGARNNTVVNVTSSSNLNYGIWLRASSANQINKTTVTFNGNIGTYVGCSNRGPIGAPCPGVALSHNNWIFTETISDNTNYGVAIDQGVTFEFLTNNSLKGGGANGKFDLFDANSNCGTDKWFGNDKTATTNPASCIK